MYRLWIEKKSDSGNFVAIEKDGERIPSAYRVDILGPSSIVFDVSTNQWPQGWVETESEIQIQRKGE